MDLPQTSAIKDHVQSIPYDNWIKIWENENWKNITILKFLSFQIFHSILKYVKQKKKTDNLIAFLNQNN